MDMGLRGKTALITGGSKGIGLACAEALAAEGCRVAIAARNAAGLKVAAESVKSKTGADVQTIAADLSSLAGIEAMIAEAARGLGRIDVLVNNAGVVTRHPILDVPLAEWDRVVRTNLYGCFHCSRLVGGHMVERGEGGKIVSISSIHGRVAKAGMGPYCATKAAIEMFSKQLAVELAPQRINVNVVASGTIITEINLPLYQSTKPEDVEKRTAVLHRVPWGEIGQPEDIGKAVAFLASDAARYITGAVLYVDGGYVADGTPRLPTGARVP